MTLLNVLLAVALVVSIGAVSQATAQAPAAGQKAPAAGEREITGEITSIDPSGKALTLKDGTKLVLQDEAMGKALKQGATVVAKYKEEGGQKLVTSIDVQSPSASPPTTPAPGAAPAPGKKQ